MVEQTNSHHGSQKAERMRGGEEREREGKKREKERREGRKGEGKRKGGGEKRERIPAVPGCLLFSLLFHPGPHPMGWSCPYSGWGLPPFPAYWTALPTFRAGLLPQLLSHMSIISGTTLRDTPRSVL
jgi:hypothetical protein